MKNVYGETLESASNRVYVAMDDNGVYSDVNCFVCDILLSEIEDGTAELASPEGFSLDGVSEETWTIRADSLIRMAGEIGLCCGKWS